MDASNKHPIVALARNVLSLRADTDIPRTTDRVRADADLTSANVWALAFAILIASVGLNVNSTAVIIGAMLISPLMGPIVGIGFALATDDVALLRGSARNLLIATIVALAASTVYFAISPLSDAQSELLARTRPTLYDVVIALFGGAAGIVAASRKAGGGNVVPGVAIATALMPPLCTAGFGLAHLDFWFFAGAMHLFLINALFIALATLLFVRGLRFPRLAQTNVARTRRTHALIAAVTLALVVPSFYTGYHVVQETRFLRAARRFVNEQIRGADRTVLNVDLRYDRDSSTIAATLLGRPLPTGTLDTLRARLPAYGLAHAQLHLRQPLTQGSTLDALGEQLRQRLSKDFAPRSAADDDRRTLTALAAELREANARDLPTASILREVAAFAPTIQTLSIGFVESHADTSTTPRKLAAVATWRTLPSASEQRRVNAFLAARLGDASIDVTHRRGP
jgi:uncharacterized hydrophobic protein (TIGR00271 family)